MRGDEQRAILALGQRGNHLRHRPGFVFCGDGIVSLQKRGHRDIDPVDDLFFGAPEDAFAELVLTVENAGGLV